MKKTLTIFILILVFLIIYFLQANFFTWFTIAGIMPNLFVILALFVSLFAGIKVGLPFAVISGLFLDIVLGKNMGISAIMLGIIAIIGGYLDKNFSKESKLTIILMVAVSTAIYEIGCYLLRIVEFSINIEPLEFTIKLLIEVFYNVILTIILYPLIQKWGYRIENIFKGNQILTRYF